MKNLILSIILIIALFISFVLLFKTDLDKTEQCIEAGYRYDFCVYGTGPQK